MKQELNKEVDFNGFKMSGFIMLFIEIALAASSVVFFTLYQQIGSLSWILGGITTLMFFIFLFGFVKLEPNESVVLLFFGKYKGTFSESGFYWINPFISCKKLSMRARNLNADPIKVNDKTGNPIMIGQIIVWRLKNTYKAMFEIDSQTIAVNNMGQGAGIGAAVSSMMRAFESFVKVQSDAALREVAGMYSYDDNGDTALNELTLRSGGKEINDILQQKLNDRLEMSGIEVVEARINYIAYSPEIAAVMLRRQQATAIIAAREKIVEGAVSMVHLALDKLKQDGVVDLDEEKKAAMVSNLLVVLCADESAQPVVNTGSLYQ